MAKINFGGVVQDARGSQNGLVYSKNKGGAYVRRKVTPVNPNSTAQRARRANFGQFSKNWSLVLTTAQRQQWLMFAAANPITNVFGASITISGLAYYNRLNTVLQLIGSATISIPPATYSVTPLPNPTALAATVGTPTFTMAVPASAAVTGTSYYIFATAPQSPGRIPNQSAYRYIGTAAQLVAGGNIVLQSLYAAKYGANIIGKQTWVQVSQVNTVTGAILQGPNLNIIPAT